MNDEPIFTKCGRELYEKKCVFWVTVLTSQKKHPVGTGPVKIPVLSFLFKITFENKPNLNTSRISSNA